MIGFVAQQVACAAARTGVRLPTVPFKHIPGFQHQLAARDTQYCDHKVELVTACADFDVYFATTTEAYNDLMPKGMATRFKEFDGQLHNRSADQILVGESDLGSLHNH